MPRDLDRLSYALSSNYTTIVYLKWYTKDETERAEQHQWLCGTSGGFIRHAENTKKVGTAAGYCGSNALSRQWLPMHEDGMRAC